ncbi:MAG: D-2-hydroxyacid dehydrogenase [Rhodospirillales bacterium]
MKVLYSLTFETPIFDALMKKHPDLSCVRIDSDDDVRRECPDADVFIVAGSHYNKKVAGILNEHAKKLRWIQATSDGLDKFVIPGIPDGVMITNTSGTKGSTIAEHAMGLLIALHQCIPEFERMRVTRQWDRVTVRPKIGSIEGQTIVTAGYGTIGKEVARKAKAFDAYVIALNRSGKNDGEADEVFTVDKLRDILPKADALFMCMPFTKQTQGLIGAAELALLKPTAVVINVARGELIDTDALVAALKNGQIAGAGLDVIDPEPLPADHPLWDFENVIISPHAAAHGGPLYERMSELFADNIERFMKGEPLRNVVNLDEHAV